MPLIHFFTSKLIVCRHGKSGKRCIARRTPPSNRIHRIITGIEWDRKEGAYKSFLLHHDHSKEEKEERSPMVGVETVAEGTQKKREREEKINEVVANMTRQCNVPHQIGEVPFCSPMTHLFPSCSNLDLFIHWRASQGVIYLYVNARCMCMCACRGMGAADEVATKQRSRFGWMQQEKEEGRQLAQLCPHMRWHMYSPSESMGVCSWPLFRSGSSLTNACRAWRQRKRALLKHPHACMHA